jgi:hypothetical protein
MIRDALSFLGAMAGTILPYRYWERLPDSFPLRSGAFASALVTFFFGASIGIPGFLEHVGYVASETNAATIRLAEQQIAAGMHPDDPRAAKVLPGVHILSFFTFLLLTPKGWATMYLMGSGSLRLASVWFDDPIGDPLLTLVDGKVLKRVDRRHAERARVTREQLEGPETPDRVVSSEKAGIPGCDLVIVAARAKPGWSRGVVVYTAETCYRIGDPVERTIAGNLRTLYPLTEHTDLEAVRRSVDYDLPAQGH